MKKLTLFSLIFILNTIALIHAEECKECVQEEPINCQQCCKAGKNVSRECAERCNRCELFNDVAKAEARDFPSNN